MAKAKRRKSTKGRKRNAKGHFVKGNRGTRRNARKNTRRNARKNTRRNKRRNAPRRNKLTKKQRRLNALKGIRRKKAGGGKAGKRKTAKRRKNSAKRNAPRRNKRRNSAKRNAPRTNKRRSTRRRKNAARTNKRRSTRRRTAKRNAPRRNRRRTSAKRNAPRRNRARTNRRRNSPRRNRGVSGRRNSPRRNRGLARRNMGEGSSAGVLPSAPRGVRKMLAPVNNVVKSLTKAFTGLSAHQRGLGALIGGAAGFMIPEITSVLGAPFGVASAAEGFRGSVNSDGSYTRPDGGAARYYEPLAGSLVFGTVFGAVPARLLKQKWGADLFAAALIGGVTRSLTNLALDFVIMPALAAAIGPKGLKSTNKTAKFLLDLGTAKNPMSKATAVSGWGLGALVRSAQLPGSMPPAADALSAFRNFGTSGRGVGRNVIKTDLERALNL